MIDLCVVGAGVSGIAAAIWAASGGLSVTLIEKNKKIGNKIYATGNGKCNLTNTCIDIKKHYNSTDVDGIYEIGGVDAGSINNVLNRFFKDIGLSIYADDAGYVYPCSNQASSVVWAMKDALEKYNVRVITNAEVTSVKKCEDGFVTSYTLKSGDEIFEESEYVLLACGGKSYPKLGGSDKGYKLAHIMGHKITDTYPALCGLKTDSSLHSAEGVRVRTTARLMVNGKEIDKSYGEIQLTAYGLSGIAIFNLSSKAVKYTKKGETVEICMNLLENIVRNTCGVLPEENSNNIGLDCKGLDKLSLNNDCSSVVEKLIIELKSNCGNRTVFGALNGITNEKLALYALERQRISTKEQLQDLSEEAIRSVISELTDYRCPITGYNDYDQAQVTSGGVALSDVDMKSFESKLVPGLYLTGEMLDIDGICGGYNITFALVSGITAAECMVTNSKR